MSYLPESLIADTLNSKVRRHERGHRGDDRIPYIHVSSLIKSSKNDFFCPREFVLRHMERVETGGAGVPPKFQLLWEVGHFYGEYIVQEFLKRNTEYAKYAWGDWTCKCGATKMHRTTLPEGAKCNVCTHPVDQYREVDLFNPQNTVIGHADLIINVNEHYYIYEFKSIERSDVKFDEIKEPFGDHLAQASNYYWMLRAEGKKVSRIIRFVYVDRSMTGLYIDKPFRDVYGRAIDKERLIRLYKRAEQCVTGIQQRKLPTRLCEAIDCGRAKQCTVAVSCFNRQERRIKRIPLDLMHRSLHLESIYSQSKATKKAGSASRSKRARKAQTSKESSE